MTDRPSTDSPSADRTDEGDNVEAHGMTDRPSTDSPSSDYLGDRPTLTDRVEEAS